MKFIAGYIIGYLLGFIILNIVLFGINFGFNNPLLNTNKQNIYKPNYKLPPNIEKYLDLNNSNPWCASYIHFIKNKNH